MHLSMCKNLVTFNLESGACCGSASSLVISNIDLIDVFLIQKYIIIELNKIIKWTSLPTLAHGICSSIWTHTLLLSKMFLQTHNYNNAMLPVAFSNTVCI